VNAPRLIASYFGTDQYERMARVLRYSAERHCPDWDIRVEAIVPPKMRSALHNQGHVENTQKMEHWASAVASAHDSDRLLLMDADTMVLRPLDALWELEFDLAYTTRTGVRLPFNSGVVAVRVSEPLRQFVTAWRDEQVRMLTDASYHRHFRDRFGGINQAALGAMFTRHTQHIRILALPCLEWNCKSELRRSIFSNVAVSRALRPLVDAWRSIETASQDACRGPCEAAAKSG
jgi:hypothetical protein